MDTLPRTSDERVSYAPLFTPTNLPQNSIPINPSPKKPTLPAQGRPLSSRTPKHRRTHPSPSQINPNYIHFSDNTLHLRFFRFGRFPPQGGQFAVQQRLTVAPMEAVEQRGFDDEGTLP